MKKWFLKYKKERDDKKREEKKRKKTKPATYIAFGPTPSEVESQRIAEREK